MEGYKSSECFLKQSGMITFGPKKQDGENWRDDETFVGQLARQEA
jgi:hypothetical protein